MKHIQTFENFLNEARALKVNLTPDMFDERSVWGIHKNTKMTGNSTWEWNSNLLADINAEGNTPGEQNVVMLQVSVFADGKSYAKVGITNHLKKEPTTTYGANYSFTRDAAEADLKKVASEAASFLMDAAHFRFISMNITSNGTPLTVTPKGDFSEAFSKVIEAAIKNK
jgi:hypothetical protein